jgi:hypothetical protein
VLDHGVGEDDVELAVGERQRTRVALHVADLRIARAEPGTIVEPERRDPLGPRIALLEKVQRSAPVALAEGELVRPTSRTDVSTVGCSSSRKSRSARVSAARPDRRDARRKYRVREGQ